MLLNESSGMPYMRSLACCLNRIVREGYTEDFQVTDAGLESVQSRCRYGPGEVHVVNSFRFEGLSGSANNAVVYIIEAADGTKGTLVRSCAGPDDSVFMRFVQQTESERKTAKN